MMFEKQLIRFSLYCCFNLLLFSGIGMLFTPFPAHAAPGDRIEVPGSWNPVGSGARALSMGGAFIAVADDATAASWNPGGLIQLEKPEISVVGAYVHRREDITFGTNPEGSGIQDLDFTDLNYLSLALPFSLLDHDMIVSLNYQKLFDFNRDWSFSLNQSAGPVALDRSTIIDQSGDLGAIGLAYSIRLKPVLSVGVTLNFWEDVFGSNEWQEKSKEAITTTIFGMVDEVIDRQLKKKNSFSGFNANLGLLWRATEKLTIGAVFKTPFTADLDIRTTSSLSIQSFFEDTFETETSKESVEVEMPMAYGLGMAYRFSDQMTLALDIYRTEWQDFLLKTKDGKVSPITGLSKSESDIDPTTQARLGVEYLFIRQADVIPLRGGIFYDPAPATGSPDDIYGISIGSGYVRGPIIFDVGYQYRWANDIGDSPSGLRDFDFSYDLEEHTIYSSLIVHF